MFFFVFVLVFGSFFSRSGVYHYKKKAKKKPEPFKVRADSYALAWQSMQTSLPFAKSANSPFKFAPQLAHTTRNILFLSGVVV